MSAKRPELNEDTANKLLANIFDACEREPNTIPLNNLISYSEYRKERYSFQKILLCIILFLFCLMPLFFISPKISVVRVSEDDAKIPAYEVSVSSGIIPISSVTASIENHGVQVYEISERTYLIEPDVNGIMSIKATLLNQQYHVKDIIVDCLDKTTPKLIEEKKIGDKLYLYIEDKESGTDYEGIYAEKQSNDEVVKPLYTVENEGLVVFAFPDDSMDIYIPDKKGNELHLVLTI